MVTPQVLISFNLCWVFCLVFANCTRLTTKHNNDSDFVVVGNINDDKDGCQYLLESFAHTSANFTFCAISHARPITLCQQCKDPYLLTVGVHDDILKLEDEAGELCKEKLLNLDRLQVVEGGFSYIKNLWDRAECDLCYDMGSDNKPKELNSRTKEILRLYNLTQECIDQHQNTTSLYHNDPPVCSECKQFYLDLNSKYNELKDSTPFCMDITDLMNSTRYEWSVTIKCCLDRQKPELLFLLATSIISVLPVVLYIMACSFSGKKKQNIVLRKRVSIPYPNEDEAIHKIDDAMTPIIEDINSANEDITEGDSQPSVSRAVERDQ
ncbi:osteopetrosis-associated transmembrane protein 1 [Nilaparvata lugens]|uniref:osteopetrosis-associated transmembrane protein 1 n=1 Tax=Nilaparvata lugens TaxID=108931 RepID=UPI00193EBFB5|nr:osteopetrosis-associated transmembrane protein 1 [Nilaparvata lugens]